MKFILAFLLLFLIKDSREAGSGVEREANDYIPFSEWKEALGEQPISGEFDQFYNLRTKMEARSVVAKEKIIEILKKLPQKLDPDFKNTLICSLIRFIEEKILDIDSEEVGKLYKSDIMRKFDEHYNNHLNIFMSVIQKTFKQNSENHVMHVCERCRSEQLFMWHEIIKEGSCIPIGSVMWRSVLTIEERVKSFYKDILYFTNKNLADKLELHLLNEIRTKPLTGKVIVDIEKIHLLLYQLRQEASGFKNAVIDERIYVILAALYNLDIIKGFVDPQVITFVSNFVNSKEGKAKCQLILRAHHYSYPGTEDLLQKYNDEHELIFTTSDINPEIPSHQSDTHPKVIFRKRRTVEV